MCSGFFEESQFLQALDKTWEGEIGKLHFSQETTSGAPEGFCKWPQREHWYDNFEALGKSSNTLLQSGQRKAKTEEDSEISSSLENDQRTFSDYRKIIYQACFAFLGKSKQVVPPRYNENAPRLQRKNDGKWHYFSIRRIKSPKSTHWWALGTDGLFW